jgi:glycosyltransferase involved in cell wall biosynthesis
MPRVSIIGPCRNEEQHLAAFADSVLAQRLPAGWTLEIVIADGMSDDGTRRALDGLVARDPRVRFVDNPERIVSSGLNRALGAATGEVVVRMDVHPEYAPDYVLECLAALHLTGADNVGGPWRAVADPQGGPTQAAVAAAFQSRWVAGGALSRQIDYDGPADTVYLGAWPRRTFERFGGFDENLVRNQDDEHNLRIVKGGGRVWQESRIHSSYRPRATLGQVFRQYLRVRLLEAVRDEEARPAGAAAPAGAGAVRRGAGAVRASWPSSAGGSGRWSCCSSPMPAPSAR